MMKKVRITQECGDLRMHQPGQLSRQSMRLLISGSWVRAPRWATLFITYQLVTNTLKLVLTTTHEEMNRVYLITEYTLYQFVECFFKNKLNQTGSSWEIFEFIMLFLKN